MTYTKSALASYRLKRSFEALADAELLLKSGTPSGALTMGLRAAKEAAEAALLAAKIEGLRSESLLFLTMEFVRDGSLTADSFNAFRTIMDLCQYAIERDFSAVNRNVISAALNSLKHFIREMGNIVKRRGLSGSD